MSELFYKIPQDLAARKDLTGNDKVLYAVIINRIGNNGKCWPGVRTLTKDCGLSIDTVGNSIHRLEAAGLLVVQRRGSGRVNYYQPPGESAPKTSTVEKTKRTENQDTSALKISTEAHRKSGHNKKDQVKRTTPGGGGFEKFWEAYPRKESKDDAEKAFRKLNPTPELFSLLIASLARQKQSDQWRRDGGRFIPHPAKWLEKRRWKDNLSDPQARTEPDAAEETAATLERYQQTAR